MTLNPSNDGDGNGPGPDPLFDNNITVPVKRFDNVGYIDIVFQVAPSTGVTEYKVTELVDNNTPFPWIGYDIILGTGTGGQFLKSDPGDGLDLDAPFALLTPPTSTAFAVANIVDEDQISFSGGVHRFAARATHSVSTCRIRTSFSRCGRFPPRCQNQVASRCLLLHWPASSLAAGSDSSCRNNKSKARAKRSGFFCGVLSRSPDGVAVRLCGIG